MITAKNLQLLDTQGNNISPAVNIETIYYEQTVKNVVHRNHIFKHFPVYVKYNGKPGTQYDGSTLNDTFRPDIDQYNNIVWPEGTSVTRHPIYAQEDLYDQYTSGDVLLHELSNPETPADIFVAGIRQSPLGNGTDFMRLDISTYNLTEILKPVAYKDWVKVRLDYYDTKLANNNIYVSELAKTPNIRQKLALLSDVGQLKKGTLVNSTNINGRTYNELIDKILLGPVEPELSNLKVNIDLPTSVQITDSALTTAHSKLKDPDGAISYNYKKITASTTQFITKPTLKINLYSCQYPKWSSFETNSETIVQPKILDMLQYTTGNSNLKNMVEKEMATDIKTIETDITIDMDICKHDDEFYLIRDFILQIKPINHLLPVYNSVGLIEYNGGAQTILAQSFYKIREKVNKAKLIVTEQKTGKPIISSLLSNTINGSITSTMNMRIPVNIKRQIKIMFPIKFGSDLKSLKTQYVESHTFGQVSAFWDPVKTFYVCIPRLIVCQMVNPLPVLHRIFQGSRWMRANNWEISTITSSANITNNKRQTEILEPYVVYVIAPTGLGAVRHIKFTIDMTTNNLLYEVEKINQQKK